MTPQQFIALVRQRKFPSACLLLGPESFQRDYCRRALVESFLAPGEREAGLIRFDLEESSLEAVLREAMTPSLFAPRRIVVVRNAEAAIPRGRVAATGEEEERSGGSEGLARYLERPPEDVVLVFEASRFAPEGDEKARLERVRKFYAPLPVVVECFPMNPEQARKLARNLAQRVQLAIGEAELDLLVESLGWDAARIAAEIEKLAIWAQAGKRVTPTDIQVLVPEARAAGVFELTDALASRDRRRALEVLELLVRQSEYLPLALAGLSSQLRLALAAQEAGWRRPEQILTQASRLGVRMWPARAQQIAQTAATFPPRALRNALELLYEADKALRDVRPDDRTALEAFVFRLTGPSS
ncbi:MAG: DNA polymerase III subunit delta [Bryobacterales bacterium]|nr:DNA polymerase III subunit delta [Bryobacteraceae bacterium]MDW8131362.1 DNA polymerase III subunit delta [Bryobacterales bacterium]